MLNQAKLNVCVYSSILTVYLLQNATNVQVYMACAQENKHTQHTRRFT